jgi:aspartyl protease family protein
MKKNDEQLSHDEANVKTNKLGQIFIWLSWCVALVLLVYVFQDVLDDQKNPNRSPENSYADSGQAEVVLRQNKLGHYLVRGEINSSSVTFLLDTGATHVSIPEAVADTLHLKNLGSYPVHTANGQVMVIKTRIKELRIGSIVLHDVAANINPGMKSDEILLGMSALKRVEFSQRGKELTLREY